MNLDKSEVMVAGRKEVVSQVKFEVNGEIMEVVSAFKYLGRCFIEDGGTLGDVKMS